MDKVQELVEKLEHGVAAVYSSDAWRELLEFQAHFHSYSWSNVMLIFLQCPTATQVAGFNKWKDLGRYVKKGEKVIQILAPLISKKVEVQDDGEEVEKPTLHGFRTVNVFDVSQTEGKPLPKLTSELDGDSETAENLVAALQSVIKISVDFEVIQNGAKGYYSPGEHRIAIQAGMRKDHTAKTIIHEYVHSLLHNKDAGNKGKSRGQIEAEAEGTAFVVANYFGLSTDEYSFPYVASWASGDGGSELVRSIGQTIQRTAHQIITTIDGYLNTESQASA